MSSGSDDDAVLAWRDPLTDEEMFELVMSHGGKPERGWWDKIRPHSLGWVTARTREGTLIGFVNVAWDGSDHAFLLDTKTPKPFKVEVSEDVSFGSLPSRRRRPDANGCTLTSNPTFRRSTSTRAGSDRQKRVSSTSGRPRQLGWTGVPE